MQDPLAVVIFAGLLHAPIFASKFFFFSFLLLLPLAQERKGLV